MTPDNQLILLVSLNETLIGSKRVLNSKTWRPNRFTNDWADKHLFNKIIQSMNKNSSECSREAYYTKASLETWSRLLYQNSISISEALSDSDPDIQNLTPIPTPTPVLTLTPVLKSDHDSYPETQLQLLFWNPLYYVF